MKTILNKKMVNALYTMVVLFAVANKVASGENVDCEEWKKSYAEHTYIHKNIKCGNTGETISHSYE